MNDEDLISVETSIEQATAAIELGECLKRLYNNKDFQQVIGKEFFVTESIYLVEELGKTATLQEPVRKEQIINNMHAISGLKRYFSKIKNAAEQARMDLGDAEIARDILLKEGLNK